MFVVETSEAVMCRALSKVYRDQWKSIVTADVRLLTSTWSHWLIMASKR